MYKAIRCVVDMEHILGVQRMRGGLWRLYLATNEDRVQLLANGISLRGKTISLKPTNPYRQIDNNNLKLRISDLPLSADDSILTQTLMLKGYEIIGKVEKEKLRVDGKLTNCNTGDRFVYIKRPSEPLHRELQAGQFKVRVYHYGQNNQRSSASVTCGKCLEPHATATCTNDWKCRRCGVSGHKMIDCPEIDEQTTEKSGILADPDESANAVTQTSTCMPDAIVRPKEPVTETASITETERKKIKAKTKKNETASSVSGTSNTASMKSIRSYFTDSDANSKTTPHRDRTPVVRSPPTPAEILNFETKKCRDRELASLIHRIVKFIVKFIVTW